MVVEKRGSKMRGSRSAGIPVPSSATSIRPGPTVTSTTRAPAVRAFFGSDSLIRRKARSDRQLQAALQVIRATPTQDDALTAAMRAQLSGKVR